MTEKVWNCLLNKYKIAGISQKISLSSVPIQNITKEMCERALREINIAQLEYIPTVNKKVEFISDDTIKNEYEKWLEGLSRNEKVEYEKWYEEMVISHLKENKDIITCIPQEALTINIINSYLQMDRNGIFYIPLPNKLTNYNEKYEDIVLKAINNMGGGAIYSFLEKLPIEYRTDKIITEAIKNDPINLDYADIDGKNFDELLQIGYKKQLENMGRAKLSKKEIELMKKFAKNNSSLFSTLNLEILNSEIVSIIGEESIERIVRYPDVQSSILDLGKNEDALNVFAFSLEHLKQDHLFIEPLIEQLSNNINIIIKQQKITEQSSNTKEQRAKFLEIASNLIQDESTQLTEEEKTIISYLALNPQKATEIKSCDDILNYVKNKNAELDGIINADDVTLLVAKDAYFQRVVGMNYDGVIDLIKKYGNDPEQLLKKYESKKLETYKEKSEKESLEIIIKLKSIVQEKDLNKIKQAYHTEVEKEDNTKSFERYKQFTILDTALKRAYGRDITQTLSNHDRENIIENVEYTEDGQEYVVKKINGNFDRMVSLMNAYAKNEAEGDMYDRWNTTTIAENHALCYSLIDESYQGTAMLGDKKGIIISISGFDAEAVVACAPYDLMSDSHHNTTVTYRQQRFFTANNLPDQTRRRYSEVDIEIQDISEKGAGYKKIQPTSIICFEKIDEDSINAAIELSKKIGRNVPIELIDRKEIAKQVRLGINEQLNQFKTEEILQPKLVEQIITKFNNIRDTHINSSLSNELVGEIGKNKNPEALFNKKHLNEMLSECIDVVKKRMENGQIQEGLDALEQIKQFVQNERNKNELMSSMYEKQIMAGIDLDIDYSINEIQREYRSQEILTDEKSESLELVHANSELNSTTFEILKNENFFGANLPDQLSFSKLCDNIDFAEIYKISQEIHKKGYYSENQSYSEEHVVRVAMFSNAIANFEGADDDTKKLLAEAVKYYSSGRMLDITEQQYQKRSVKIARKELSEKYSKENLGVILASIELQDLKCSNLDEQQEERNKKIDELCNKYGVREKDRKRVDMVATYLSDAITLDKSRFIPKVYYSPGEKLEIGDLKTDIAKRLIKDSYCLQDKLSAEHLKYMKKVANINYNAETSKIMDEYFSIKRMGNEPMYSNTIVESPIVQEEYFRDKYSEIKDPVKLGQELDKEQQITSKAKKQGKREKNESVINFSTINRAIEKNKEKIDEQSQQQSIEEITR